MAELLKTESAFSKGTLSDIPKEIALEALEVSSELILILVLSVILLLVYNATYYISNKECSLSKDNLRSVYILASTRTGTIIRVL